MTSNKTAELDAPAPIYEEDQTMQPGEEKVIKQETKGSRWVTNLVTKKNGTVVSDEFFHNSTYRGKPATIKRNTTGAVVPATEPSQTVPENHQGNTPTQTLPGSGPGTNAGETAPTTVAETQNTPATQAETEGTTAENTQSIIQPNPMSQ